MKSIAVYYKIHEGIDNKVSSENYDNQKWKSTTTEGLKPFSDVGELHVNIWKVNEGRLKLHPVFYADLGIKVSFKCEQNKIVCSICYSKREMEGSLQRCNGASGFDVCYI